MPLILGAHRIESQKKQKRETKLRSQQALLAFGAALVRSFMGLCAAFSFKFGFAYLVWGTVVRKHRDVGFQFVVGIFVNCRWTNCGFDDFGFH